ncbi:MAG: hypothetical protein ACI4XM_04465 [Candidatus Coprovivens sp.]
MNEEQFKKLDIGNEIKIKPAIINLPEKKDKDNKNDEKIIVELPTWNIEPPIEIKRGEQ